MLAQCLPLRRVCRPLALLAGLLSLSVLPAASVHAQTVSTDGKNSVMTVPVDAGIDAAFFFDGLTRNLTGFVLNNVGVPNIRYKIRLDDVFRGPGGKSIKDPIYLFATGKVSATTPCTLGEIATTKETSTAALLVLVTVKVRTSLSFGLSVTLNVFGSTMSVDSTTATSPVIVRTRKV